METFGAITHWKPGPAEAYGQVHGLPVSPSITSLQPGDRIIFQNDPTARRDGNHHTGIYVGSYKGMKHAVVHCNGSANTVSVNELMGRLWRIYRYSVRGTQKRPPGQVAARGAQAGKD
jgi:cell wall-associated NlpC family hydrolase